MEPRELEPVGAERKILFQGGGQFKDCPALWFPEGSTLIAWKLSDEERRALINGADIHVWLWLFNRPLQPMALEVAGVREGSI